MWPLYCKWHTLYYQLSTCPHAFWCCLSSSAPVYSELAYITPDLHITLQDELVLILGSRADPWKIRATLRSGGSDPDAELIGNTICGFKDGICEFENLGISHSGSGYIIGMDAFKLSKISSRQISLLLCQLSISI